MKLLRDILTIDKGGKYNLLEKYQEGAIRVFQANDFRNEDKILYTTDKGGVLADQEDILLVWDGSVGQMGFGKYGYVGSTMVRLRITDRNHFLPEFVFRFLQSQSEYLKRKATGATIKHISRRSLEDLEIPDLSINEQSHITATLRKAEHALESRKESDRLLDEFLKATFLKMFGDPLRNDKQWKEYRVEDIGDSRLGKMLDGKKITGNNLKPYLRNTNVLWFGFKLDDLMEMDFDRKDQEEFSLRYGDVLMCEGGEIGRCAIWKNELSECYFQKAIHRIRLDSKIVLPDYFVFMFWLYTMHGGLKKYMGAATISHLTGEKLKKIKLPIPPIKEQQRFVTIASQTYELQSHYKESQAELEKLKHSLFQRIFNNVN